MRVSNKLRAFLIVVVSFVVVAVALSIISLNLSAAEKVYYISDGDISILVMPDGGVVVQQGGGPQKP